MKGSARLRGPQRADSHVPWLTNSATTWRLPTPRSFPGGAWHGVRQPPPPEGHTNTRIQHANYVAERCTPRYYRTLTTRTHKPCPYYP